MNGYIKQWGYYSIPSDTKTTIPLSVAMNSSSSYSLTGALSARATWYLIPGAEKYIYCRSSASGTETIRYDVTGY